MNPESLPSRYKYIDFKAQQTRDNILNDFPTELGLHRPDTLIHRMIEATSVEISSVYNEVTNRINNIENHPFLTTTEKPSEIVYLRNEITTLQIEIANMKSEIKNDMISRVEEILKEKTVKETEDFLSDLELL